ncbi:MAG TPA: S1 RNA-binding domain-containing protein, partial [Candidatus Olsenella excrementigallinarum]|nr:S1 RNA-binding domain-containing protein [Candidatus Olsenella excrementigallinarum]
EDPWRTLVKKYPVDAIVEGTVTKLVTFGAFVDLGEGVEGLVHISEMAKQHVDQPSQVCAVGDTVQVKVMEIDLDRRRISLSMKAAAETLGIEVEVKPLPESDRPAEEPEAEETVEE